MQGASCEYTKYREHTVQCIGTKLYKHIHTLLLLLTLPPGPGKGPGKLQLRMRLIVPRIWVHRKTLRKPLKCTYIILLNQQQDQHRLPPSPRTDPLDSSLVHLSFKGQTKTKRSSDSEACGQRLNSPHV